MAHRPPPLYTAWYHENRCFVAPHTMEARRDWAICVRRYPRVGDALFSTLRRPLLALLRDDVSPGLDLLRHDGWLPGSSGGAIALCCRRRWACVPAGGGLAVCPHVFARTVIAVDGRLVPQPAPASAGDVMTLRAAADLAVAAIAAGGSGEQAVIVDVDDHGISNLVCGC